MKASFSVLDHFWKKPWELTDETKTISFSKPMKPELKCRSKRSKFAAEIEKMVGAFLGEPVKWAVGNGSGTYRTQNEVRIKQSSSGLWIHQDQQYNIVGILYLNQPEYCHGGTGFFRHCKTQLDGFHDLAALHLARHRLGLSSRELAKMIINDIANPKAWEKTDFVSMKYNRFIVFNGQQFHSHIVDFRKVPKNAERLTFAVYGTSAKNPKM